MVASWNPFFLKRQFHILHFLDSTGLFTKPTSRHYTKFRFSPDIGVKDTSFRGGYTLLHVLGPLHTWAKSRDHDFIYLFWRQKVDMPVPKHGRQLTIWQVFRQVERIFRNRDSNWQPLLWDLGISPPSFGSLRSSRTSDHKIVRAQRKLSKSHPNTPPNYVVWSRNLKQMLFQWIYVHVGPHTW